jgi:rubrerythrin
MTEASRRRGGGAIGSSHHLRAEDGVTSPFESLAFACKLDAMQGAAVESPKLSLVCSSCGYGVVVAAPPERCPMCHRRATWNHRLWRPFSARSG